MLKPTKSEMDAMMSGSAIYANRFVALTTPSGVRVAFMETAPDSDEFLFRSAVLLSYQDAIELRNLLSGIVEPVEKQLSTVSSKSRLE